MNSSEIRAAVQSYGGGELTEEDISTIVMAIHNDLTILTYNIIKKEVAAYIVQKQGGQSHGKSISSRNRLRV